MSTANPFAFRLIADSALASAEGRIVLNFLPPPCGNYLENCKSINCKCSGLRCAIGVSLSRGALSFCDYTKPTYKLNQTKL